MNVFFNFASTKIMDIWDFYCKNYESKEDSFVETGTIYL